ncbi:electron transfer flavoprotein subunit beta/FixA family protein [Ferrimicrobium sp.]|uniref:electron transfer flavoprotein subunit beta/FixA family protein n=1 Tax=Ferrimicrobium sp. TaxID=2926050 RepID=UPI00260AFC38|nr:electron transfer flavoprotein subunit beta/FixA family protein [Ferrimicrobium sp.]
MKIAVCVKQISDPSEPQRIDPTSLRLTRASKAILDDSDAYGVEIALRLAEVAGGAEVLLVSMAPNQEVQGVRTGLAMGATSAVVVSDPGLAGADALTTAKVLASVVQRIGADLVIAATESTDGYTGTVPAQIAAVLDWPALTFAKQIELRGSTLSIQRQTEDGYDVVEADLPAVVSVTAGVVEPRYPSFKGIMSAKSKPVEQLSLTDLGLTVDVREQVVAVEDAEARAAGQIVEDDGSAEADIINYLTQIKVL